MKWGLSKSEALIFLKLCHIEAALYDLVDIEDAPLPGDEWRASDDE